MKRAARLLGAGMLMLSSMLYAAVPALINFQGKLTDAVGNPVVNGVYTLTVNIYDDSTAGNVLWTEVRPVQVSGGLFTVPLGASVPLPDNLFSSGTNRFLGVAVNLDPEIAPRTRLISVPYAYQAQEADQATIALDVTCVGCVSATKVDPTQVQLRVTGTALPGRYLTGINQDGTVITAPDQTGAGVFLPLAGGTMTGPIANTGDPAITMGKGNFGAANVNSGTQAFVAGGNNRARGAYSVVSGGGGVTAADSNSALGDYSVIGGGFRNTTSGLYTTVGGGNLNTASGGGSATVGGGNSNTASGLYATVGGGFTNTASSLEATVGGGYSNTASGFLATVGGGHSNTASGAQATVGGGRYDTASGVSSTIPGGYWNKAAGDYSFAAGRQAKADHNGAFVWADNSVMPFASTAANQFNVRATGGVQIYSNLALTAGVTLAPGASAWAAVSDSTLKRNIRLVDGKEILAKVAQLPIKRWSYKAQDPQIEHIGPMAQDFYALFGVGDDDKMISTIDPPGIALAAIQELHRTQQELSQKTLKIDQQEQQIGELRAQLRALQNLVQTLLASQNREVIGEFALHPR